jgi:Uma2 family endonuclease
MAMQKTAMSISEFAQYSNLPENADRRLELIDGEVVEMAPARARYSKIGLVIASSVYIYCQNHNLPSPISGADGAYEVNGHVIAPDFAYKDTPLSEEYPDPVAPLWAVEVISPTDKATDIRKKRQIYQDAGILLWEVYYKLQRVDIYAPGQPMRAFGIDDVLDGDEVLPGFTLAVKELFAE